MDDFWGEPIDCYTRAKALADGVLVDVSETAREAGFRVPVAVTAAVMADVEDRGEREGRLWDLLFVAAAACRRHPSELVLFDLVMPVGGSTNYRAKLHLGPGDDGEMVGTIMRPDED